MNLFRKIVNLFTRESGNSKPAGGVAPAPLTDSVYALFSGNSAMCVATVFRCVKLLSESIANLPLMYQKRVGGVYVDAGDEQLNYLLNVQPDFALSSFDFWRQVGQELLMDGNAYIVPPSTVRRKIALLNP